MLVQVQCPNCSQPLTIPQNSAGQSFQCPTCSQQVTTHPIATPRAWVHPAPIVSTQTGYFPPPPPPLPQWYVRTPDGKSFGPVPKTELDSWVVDGSVPGDSLILQEGASQWQQANLVYPILSNQINNNIVVNVGGDYGGGDYYSPSRSGRMKQPHRASLVMTLALLGWFLFAPLCIFAWVMAADDLKQMRLGRMDRSGEGTTHIACIMGMIGTILIGLAVVAVFLVLLAAG